MNENELISNIAEKIELTKKDVEAVTHGTLEKETAVFKIGMFETGERLARSRHNPQTGETIEIATSIVSAFHPGNKRKEMVQQ